MQESQSETEDPEPENLHWVNKRAKVYMKVEINKYLVFFLLFFF